MLMPGLWVKTLPENEGGHGQRLPGSRATTAHAKFDPVHHVQRCWKPGRDPCFPLCIIAWCCWSDEQVRIEIKPGRSAGDFTLPFPVPAAAHVNKDRTGVGCITHIPSGIG